MVIVILNYNTKSMKQILYLLAIVVCMWGLSAEQFSPTRAVHMPANVKQIQYSPDQKVLAVSTDISLLLFEGVTLNQIKTINYPAGLVYSSLSFSQDDSLMAVGFSSDKGTCNYSIYSTAKTGAVQDRVAGLQDFTGKVNGICFSADNTHLVMGTSNGDIVLVNLRDSKVTSAKFGDSIPINAVACSPYRSLEFAVAGGGDGLTQKLSIFNYDFDTGIITQIKDVNTIKQQQVIYSLTYSPSGREIYRGGSSNTIYINNVDNLQPRFVVFPVGNHFFLKLRISQDEQIVAANTVDTLLILQTAATSNVNLQVIPIVIATFAMGPRGANVAYLAKSTEVQVAGQCPDNQFLNATTSTCQLCNQNCQLCLDTATTCFLCKQAFYVTPAYSCLGCVVGCKVCTTGNSCHTCYEGFVPTQNNLCGCEKGKYLNVNTCTTCPQGCLQCENADKCSSCSDDYDLNDGKCSYQGGIPTWVIILLIIIGVAFLVVISGIIIIKMKRAKKHSPLLSDQDQGQKNSSIKQ